MLQIGCLALLVDYCVRLIELNTRKSAIFFVNEVDARTPGSIIIIISATYGWCALNRTEKPRLAAMASEFALSTRDLLTILK